MALPKFRIKPDPRNNPRTHGKMWLFCVSLNGAGVNNWRLCRSGDVVELPEGAGGSALFEALNPEGQAALDAYLTIGATDAGNERPRWPNGLGRW